MKSVAAPAPLVSVLLPVHNGGPFLSQALESVLGQTLNDLEVIAVENGSTDGSLEILRASADQDPRVSVVEAGPVGLVAALNLAVETARGRFLARMDADDVAEPGRLAAQVEFLSAHPGVGVVGTAHDYIDAAGVVVGARRFVTDPPLVEASFYFGNPLAHSTVMIDRERTGRVQYPSDAPDAEDLALWLGLARAGVIVANVPDVLMHYRVHADSVTAQPGAAVGTSDVDAVVRAARWATPRSRWAISRTYNARSRGVGLVSFLAGVLALNCLNLLRPEVGRWALLRRSALALGAAAKPAGRRSTNA
ncbi:MAG: glycosyltransferase [Microthrixaceae bacterium]